MQEIYEIRRDNLLVVVANQYGGSRVRFTEIMGFRQNSFVSRLLNGGQTIGSRLARKIERQCGLATNSMDHQARPSGAAPADIESVLVRPYRSWDKFLGSPLAHGVALSAEWIKSHLPNITSPLNLRTMVGSDDAMATTIAKGDLMLIDTGVDHAAQHAVYLITLDKAEYVRRLQRRLDGGLTAQTDNAKFVDEAVPADALLGIKGRVVYVWNGKTP